MTEQSFLDHLQELRNTLLKCVVSIVIAYTPSYFLTPHLIEIIISCSSAELTTFNYFSPLEVFIVQLKMALALAIVISFPYISWQIWKFLLPALYPNEKVILKRWFLAAIFLFLTGITFCFLWILPLVMRFALSFSSDTIIPTIGISNFLLLTGWLILAFGLMFQFPLLIVLSVRFGLVKKTTLKNGRPYIVIAILIMAAILTPPDIISQILLAVPTYLLFELGLFLARDNPETITSKNDDMLDFYIKETDQKHSKDDST
jgi:sec-independent protein translocase protein TatC